MAKGSAPVSRLSKEYNPNTLKKELDRISRAVNRISAKNEDIDNRISREIVAVRKSVDVATQFGEVQYFTEWYEEESAGVKYAVAKLAFVSGWGKVADVQYRHAAFGNTDEAETWVGLLGSPTSIEWVEDDGTGEINYPQGGYYRFRAQIGKFVSRERKTGFQVHIRAVDAGGYALVQESNVFDLDTLPDVMSMSLRVGEYDGTNWNVYATGQCDLDSLSVGLSVRSSIGTTGAIAANNTPTITLNFTTLSYDLYIGDVVSIGAYSFVISQDVSAGSGVTVTADASTPSDAISSGTVAYADWSSDEDNLTGLGFNDYQQNLTSSNKNFDVLIGQFAPGVPVFAIAAAFNELSLAGESSDKLYQRATITTPQPEYVFDAAVEINDGDITANMLAGAAQRASVKIDLAHKGFTTALEDVLTYSGTITWGDGTEYTLSSGDIPNGTPPVPTTPQTLYYIFHDPDSSADNDSSIHTVSDPETDLQITSNEDLAGDISGRRILVGVYSVGTENGEAAYFVSNTKVSITAPFIYAAKLSALSADMGTINAGTIALTATVEWGAVAGTANAPDDNATYGATWDGTLSNIPVRFNSNNTPSASGLYASPDYFGFYDFPSLAWKTYMDSSGNFALSGSGTNYLSWNGTTLALQGQMVLTSGSDVDFDDVSGVNKPENGATAGADWDNNLDNIPLRLNEDDTPAASGLYVSPNYLGFWDATSAGWKAYIDSSGNFGLAGDANNSVTWNGTNFSVATTGTFTHKNVSSGKTATLINGIFYCDGPATAYYDGSSATVNFGGSSTAFLDGSFLHLTGSTADIRLGNILTPPFVLNASSITRTGAFTISATTDINLSAGGNINLGSLPTSSTGLSAGDLWNDAGTVKIV